MWCWGPALVEWQTSVVCGGAPPAQDASQSPVVGGGGCASGGRRWRERPARPSRQRLAFSRRASDRLRFFARRRAAAVRQRVSGAPVVVPRRRRRPDRAFASANTAVARTSAVAIPTGLTPTNSAQPAETFFAASVVRHRRRRHRGPLLGLWASVVVGFRFHRWPSGSLVCASRLRNRLPSSLVASYVSVPYIYPYCIHA